MTTCVRRKPTITYQSPSASDSAFLPRDYGRRRHASSSSSTSTSSSASSSSHAGPNANANPTGAKQQSTTIAQKTTRGHTRDTADSLSLFHPLGRLAASLPPFDPRPYGLPILPERPSASTTSTSSSRTQRKSGGQRPGINGTANAKSSTPSKTTTKTTGATGTASPSGSGAGAAVADADNATNDVDAKAATGKSTPAPTQRKSRKRKRVVTAEDSDATYPARKTRAPRIASNTNTVNRRGTSEEEMPPPALPPIPEPEPVDQPMPAPEDSETPEFKIEQRIAKMAEAEGTGSSGKPDAGMEKETAMDVSPDVPVAAPTAPVPESEPEKPVAAAAAVDPVVEAAPVEVAPPPPAVDQKKPPPLAVVEEEEKEEGELST